MSEILEFIDGIAFFLFGMTVMSRGLQAFAGEGLSEALSRLCRTPLRGVAVGALVTPNTACLQAHLLPGDLMLYRIQPANEVPFTAEYYLDK